MGDCLLASGEGRITCGPGAQLNQNVFFFWKGLDQPYYNFLSFSLPRAKGKLMYSYFMYCLALLQTVILLDFYVIKIRTDTEMTESTCGSSASLVPEYLFI